MRKTKICLVCKKQFQCYHEGKYCSYECYWKFRWGKEKKCRNCGKEAKFRYCSNKCSYDYWNKNDYRLIKKRRIWEKKIALIKELGGKCRKCGIGDFQVLEINHIDKDKKERPPKLQYTWQRRLKEWNKNKFNLELLCANCHRKLTWIQMGWGKY